MSDAREQQLLEEIARRDEEIARLRAENELLRQKVDLILRKLFSARSETLDVSQLELLLDPDSTKKDPAADPEDEGPAADTATKKTTAKRTPRDLSNLEVREETLVPASVKANPDAFRKINEVHTDRFNYQRAKVFIERTIRPVYVKHADPDATPFKAPAPPALRPGLKAAPELLAHILVAKFCDHLPFYRQESIFRSRFGVEIPRNTLCNWAGYAADALEPLSKLIHSSLLQRSYLQADETPIRYLDPGRGRCARGYFWVLRGPPPKAGKPGDDIFFQWHPGRGAICIDDLLGGGADVALQTDGYAAYASWASEQPCIVLIACWAHARRKFREALDAGQTLAAAPLQLIQQIYRIETDLRENGSGVDECRLVRQAQTAPILDRFKTEIIALRKHPGVLPKSSLGKAIDYTLALWDRLIVYLGDGSIEIDNNGIENVIRPTAVGKKNWLFVGSKDGGKAAARLLVTLLGPLLLVRFGVRH